MDMILGTILGGSLVAIIVAYFLMLGLTYRVALHEHSGNKGIKKLKFQDWNPAKKYVT